MSTLPSLDGARPTTPETEPAIRITELSRSFGAVRALSSVSFDVPAGQVTALLGENGAGKSTLLKILAGLQPPSDGSVSVFGQPVTSWSPDSLLTEHGVAIVPQELALLPDRTVAQNVLAGMEPGNRFFPSTAGMNQRTEELLDQLDLRLDPTALVRGLDLATQQLVVVARSLARGARVLILDEPTSVLTPAESDRLFALMGRLKAEGTTMVYVSHRMPEVFALADRIEVLRDGRHVAGWDRADTTPDQAVAAMVGRELGNLTPRAEASGAAETRGPALVLRGLTGPRYHDVDLEVRPGEIVGLAGLPDSGRVELLHDVFGATRGSAGVVELFGEEYRDRTPIRSVAHRLAFVPGERRAQGLLTTMDVGSNIGVLGLPAATRWGLLRRSRFRRSAEEQAQRMHVKTASIDEPVVNLSGGNQQKAVLGRWLAIRPRVLILDEPTRGVDVGAKAEIYEQLFELARGGMAIVCSSSDLPELLTVTDRIAVMSEGRLVGTVPTAAATEESVMTLATGATPAHPATSGSHHP